MLRNSTFPHVALLLVSSGTRASLAASFSGAKSPQAFINVLAQAIEGHGAALVAARVDAEERVRAHLNAQTAVLSLTDGVRTAVVQDYNRLIRAQQDAEFEASLAADQARAAQLASAREEEERVARMQAEQEAAEKAAADAAAAAAAERANALAARQAASAAALAPEPQPGPGAVQVRGRHMRATFLVREANDCLGRSCCASPTASGCSAALMGRRPRRRTCTDGRKRRA